MYMCSRQMAEEVLRGGGAGEVDQSTGFEGMETLARAIELGKVTDGGLHEERFYYPPLLVLARVQISLKDTVFQVNYEPPDVGRASRHFLQLRIGE